MLIRKSHERPISASRDSVRDGSDFKLRDAAWSYTVTSNERKGGGRRGERAHTATSERAPVETPRQKKKTALSVRRGGVETKEVAASSIYAPEASDEKHAKRAELRDRANKDGRVSKTDGSGDGVTNDKARAGRTIQAFPETSRPRAPTVAAVACARDDDHSCTRSCCRGPRGPRGHRGRRGPKGATGSSGSTGGVGATGPMAVQVALFMVNAQSVLNSNTTQQALLLTRDPSSLSTIQLDVSGTFITGLTGSYTYVYEVAVDAPTTKPLPTFALGSGGQTVKTSGSVAASFGNNVVAMQSGTLGTLFAGTIGIINTSQPPGATTIVRGGKITLYLAVPSSSSTP